MRFSLALACLGTVVGARRAQGVLAKGKVGESVRGESAVLVSSESVKTSIASVLGPLLVASALTTTLTYPIDILRASRMANAASGGAASAIGLGGALRMFDKGLAPELFKGTLSRVIKFGGFPIAHAMLTGGTAPEHGTASSRALAGALSTVPEMALITPLEVAKLALQLDALGGGGRFGNSLLTATRSLVQAAGPKALYAGHFGLQLRQAVWTAVYFASAPAFAAALKHARGGRVGADADADADLRDKGVAGLFAGALGACCNAPIDVCRSVAQKGVLTNWVLTPGSGAAATRAPYVGETVAAFRSVVRQRGVSGLWTGCGFKSLHLGLGGALMAALQPICGNAWRRAAAPRLASKGALSVARGGGTGAGAARFENALAVRGGVFAGYNPFGILITDSGKEFLTIHGCRESDLGALLATLKNRKRASASKSEWLEIMRIAKSGQSARIYRDLDKLLAFLLAAGFVA